MMHCCERNDQGYHRFFFVKNKKQNNKKKPCRILTSNELKKRVGDYAIHFRLVNMRHP